MNKTNVHENKVQDYSTTEFIKSKSIKQIKFHSFLLPRKLLISTRYIKANNAELSA